MSKQVAFLKLLGKTKNKKKRKLLLDFAGKEEIGIICTCISHVLKGKMTLPKNNIRKLKTHKKSLRTLSKKNISMEKKKKILKQKGGILSSILPFALLKLAKLLIKIKE